MAKLSGISREIFYEPAPPPEHANPLKWRFGLDTMGSDFFNAYKALKGSISTGELPFRAEYLGMNDDKDEELQEGLTYLIPTGALIRWALIKGFRLPDNLQKIINVPLFEGAVDKTSIRNVKVKITGQFILHYDTDPLKKSAVYLCNHSWMQMYIETPEWRKTDYDNEIKDKTRTVKNIIDTLLEPYPGGKKTGNRSKTDKSNRPYLPKAIQEVISVQASQKRYYYIPLLKIAMETAANLLLGIFLEKGVIKQTQQGLNWFLDEFMKNEVVSLYTSSAPPLVLDLMKSFAYETVCSFFLETKKL